MTTLTILRGPSSAGKTTYAEPQPDTTSTSASAMFHPPNQYRIRTGPLASTDAYGCNGAFLLEGRKRALMIIASDGGGWEHVSVSLPDRCPTWDEMCAVKALFWDPDDCVMQLHPPASRHVNNHPNCLHLWRPVGIEIPQPPSIMVGLL